ncbi:TPA: restriction endonuclease subunit S [Vibrio parahaemolyticus]
MTVENLITEHIDIWTSAVKTKSTSGRGSSKKLELYGVKKLRELILELAVRGKLVPQDPNDEPASVLLERIARDKAQLIKDKKIKKNRKQPEITQEEIYFSVPENWSYARLEDIYDVRDGTHDSPKPTSKGYPLVTSKNLSSGKLDLSTAKLISKEDHLKVIERSRVDRGDILFAMIGSIGNPVIVDTDIEFSIKNVGLFKYYNPKDSSPNFLNYFLKYAAEIMKKQSTGGVQPFVSLGKLRGFVMPIPPISEQHRIVAKVDELMALCDQLEQQTEASIEAHRMLVTTLLDTLTNSADADELMQNWARISEHFDTLFSTEESIDQLKQTILQLAVMGALSQPLNSDTSIDVHLDNILEQQKQLATAKEYSLIEAEVLKAKNEISNNRVVLKARCFCNFITKGTTPSKNELLETGDVPFLKVYNIVNNELDFDYRPIFISNEVHTSKLKRSIAHPGDVIMNIVGPPLGKVAVLSEQYPQWNMNQALAVFKPVSSVFNRYLYYVLSCELTLRSVLSEVKGTAGQDNLSLEQCRDLLVPIMSIQEQQRLVCLVNSLWDYCDRLKKRMKSSQKTQLHLTDAVTGQAV